MCGKTKMLVVVVHSKATTRKCMFGILSYYLVHKQLVCTNQNYDRVERQGNEELIEAEGDSGGLALLSAVCDPGLKPGLV